MKDPISPSHYYSRDESGIACSDALRSMLGREGYQAYLAGTVMKYLWRYTEKNGIEDLRKAGKCIEMLITEINKN